MQKPLASQLGILIIYLSLYISFVISLESEKQIDAVKLAGSQNVLLRKLIIPLGN